MYAILDELKTAFASALSSTSIKKYYVGKVHNSPINYLPVFMVYAEQSTLISRSTARDRWQHIITIEVLTNAYNKVNQDGVEADGVLDAQKEIWDLFAGVDGDNEFNAATIGGALEGIILGTDYLYHHDIVIEYSQENVDGTVYYSGKATFTIDEFKTR